MRRARRFFVATFTLTASALTTARAGDITTLDVTTAAVNPQCLNYCYTGVCFFLRCGLRGCSIVTTPRIEHYNPDLVVSAYNGVGENPWVEARAALGIAQRSTANTLLGRLIGGVTPAAGHRNAGSTKERKALRHKEVDAVGHPLASLASLATLAGGGGAGTTGARVPSSFGDQQLSNMRGGIAAAEEWSGRTQSVESWAGVVSPLAGDIANGARQVNTAAQSLGTLADAADTVSAVSTAASSFLGLTGSLGIQVFCPSAARSFVPYYQSALDPIAWRFGIPEMLYPEALTPGRREIGNWPTLTWGHVYPRAGSIGTTDDPKAAAVAAQRAADFITRPNQPHVYLPSVGRPRGGYWPASPVLENTDNHRWQMLTPIRSSRCEIFGAGGNWSGGKVDTRGNYAWILWRKYSCCTARSGVFLSSIETARVCLN